MEIKKNDNISTFKRFRNIISHGLLFFGIRNRLARIGLDINPYYWVQEEVEPCKEPIIRGDSSEFRLKYLSIKEFKFINDNIPKFMIEEMIEGLRKGQQCIGLEHHGEIAAHMFYEPNDFTYGHRHFKLNKKEAYLLNMWVHHSYRGKNIAAYLRYKSYRILENQGIDTKYSITQYFNKSSIKFKRKLNSKHLKLYISIVLFKKYHWNFRLRTYK